MRIYLQVGDRTNSGSLNLAWHPYSVTYCGSTCVVSLLLEPSVICLTHPVQNVPGTRSRPLCSERSGTRGQGRRVSVAASRMRRVLGPILTLTRRYTPPPLVRPPSLTCSQRAESSSLDLVSSGELKG